MIPEDWDPEQMRDRMEIVIGESGNIEMNSYTQKIPMQTIGIYDFSDKEDLFEIGDGVTDTEYYILFKDKNMDMLQKRIRTVILGLSNCGLDSVQVSNADLRIILDNFLNGGKTTEFGTVVTS